MHKVVVNRAQALVSVVAEGFVDDAELAAAAGELHRAIRSLGDQVGRHVTLYDLSGLKVASPATLKRFAGYWTDPAVAPLLAHRVALVSGSTMVTLQLARVEKVRDTIRVFEDRRAAMAWLLGDQDRLRTTSQPTAASG